MKVYLGIGSNTGDRFGNLREAVQRLDNTPGICVRRISHVYETYPVGGPEQPDYFNAVIEVETALKAKEILECCLGIEKEMGRVRKERCGPRNIDIDIELYGDHVLKTDDLTVPHPLMHKRAFVLKPLADIAPGRVHPVLGLSVKEMLAKVVESGVRKVENVKL